MVFQGEFWEPKQYDIPRKTAKSTFGLSTLNAMLYSTRPEVELPWKTRHCTQPFFLVPNVQEQLFSLE